MTHKLSKTNKNKELGKRRYKSLVISELVPDRNGYWVKDKSGVVWQIVKTPFKDIPIVYIDWKKELK